MVQKSLVFLQLLSFFRGYYVSLVAISVPLLHFCKCLFLTSHNRMLSCSTLPFSVWLLSWSCTCFFQIYPATTHNFQCPPNLVYFDLLTLVILCRSSGCLIVYLVLSSYYIRLISCCHSITNENLYCIATISIFLYMGHWLFSPLRFVFVNYFLKIVLDLRCKISCLITFWE